jgi:hypothetical protein
MGIEWTAEGKNQPNYTLKSKGAPRVGALLAALIAVFVISFTAGCVGNMNGATPNSNTKRQRQLSLQFTPASLNFGSVPAGTKISEPASVTNTGQSSITITQIVSSSNQFTISGLTFPLTLAPAQTANFLVWFTGSATGSTTGTLTFQGANASVTAAIPVAATAATPQPKLTVSPANLDAGSATVGSKTTSNITLSNTGTADLTISIITVLGAPFNVTGIATPKVISAGQSVTMGVTYAPTAAGTDSGSISIVSNDPASPATIALSGSGTNVAVGHLTINPSTLTFGNVAVGSSSVLSATITNNGQAAVHISQVFASGTGFSDSGLATPATLAAGQSAQVQVTFAPTATGLVGGTVGISSDAPGAAPGLALSGTGVQPAISVSPASISFGSIVDGQSKSQAVTITNTGTANLTVTQLGSTAAGVSISGVTMPLTIAAGQSGTFSALYAPQTAGSTSGNITIASNAPASPASVAVSGTGVAATTTLAVSPTSLSFGNVSVGGSANKTVTITNTGNSSATISQVGVTGQGLTVSGVSAPSTLTPGQSASLSVQFSPATTSAVNGSVSIVSQSGTTSVSVTGSGAQANLAVSPGSLTFTNVLTGSTNSQAVQLTNSGNASLTVTQANVTGSGFSTSGLSLPLTLSAGQSTSFNVQFIPQSAGTVTGGLSLVSNAANSTASVALSGSSLAATHTLSVSPSSLSFGSVSAGSTSTQLVTLTNTGNSSVAVSQISASGTGFALSGANVPVTLTVGQSTSFSVRFTPTTAGSDSGSVLIVSDATNSPASITLSGSSPAATYTLSESASSLSFGSVNTGSGSTQTVTLTNTGNAQVTISQISVSGTGFALTGAGTSINLPAGMTFAFGVQFAPATAGAVTGQVSIASNATGSPAAIALSGTGVAQPVQYTVQLNWAASTSQVVGYNVYRTTTSGSGYTPINGSLVAQETFSDSTVQPATTYYYVTTAVDGSGNESGYSNEAQAIVP